MNGLEDLEELTVSVATQLYETAVTARLQLTNLTAAAGIEASPEAVVLGALISLGVVFVLVLLVCKTRSALRARARARNNALAVRMAECAPDDDCDEHEVEIRECPRTAAPGDSDHEEDPSLVGKR